MSKKVSLTSSDEPYLFRGEVIQLAKSNKSKRGFASMDREQQRLIASKGGKAAHRKGTAHEWTSEEAKAAGRRGGRK